ncbi:MAG: TIGR01777 family oxidoreductase [Planctomycetes bacterium]|nr:TIGR01777 family oxidoreductase [Planctomycetota bacterium]
MKYRQFSRTCSVDASGPELFAWHARPGAFQRLLPPWESAEIIEQKGTIRDGDKLVLQMKVGPLKQRWVAEHVDYIEGHQFADKQTSGPFAHWEHFHQIQAAGPESSKLTDRIEYALPLGAVTQPLLNGSVQRRLSRMFAYRHRVTQDDLAAHHRYIGRAPLRVLVTGSGGLIGSSLIPMLTTGGHTVARMTRTQSKRGGIRWDPDAGEIDPSALEGFDAVVHLAGENIAGGRWNEERKRRILESRTKGTSLLAGALAKLKNPPKVFACASAIGFYGNRGDETLDERSPAGEGYLADVCKQWEAAAEPARAAGIRTVNMRFGIVLGMGGGALAKMLTPFKLGAGGNLGSGKQWMSWVALDDAVGAIHHALFNEALTGPMNVVAPTPVTNAEFTKTLGRVVARPTIFPMPAFAARLALGEMADALLLASTRVLPQALQLTDYRFRFPTLEEALRHLLGRMKNI